MDLLNSRLALVLLQECDCLLSELLEVRKRDETRKRELDMLTHLVSEVCVDDLPLVLLNELHQQSKAVPHVLKHGERDALPPLNCLKLSDQGHLLGHTGDGRVVLQEARNSLDLVPEPSEP